MPTLWHQNRTQGRPHVKGLATEEKMGAKGECFRELLYGHNHLDRLLDSWDMGKSLQTFYYGQGNFLALGN